MTRYDQSDPTSSPTTLPSRIAVHACRGSATHLAPNPTHTRKPHYNYQQPCNPAHLVEVFQQQPPQHIQAQAKDEAHAGAIGDADAGWGRQGVGQAGQGSRAAPADDLLRQAAAGTCRGRQLRGADVSKLTL